MISRTSVSGANLGKLKARVTTIRAFARVREHSHDVKERASGEGQAFNLIMLANGLARGNWPGATKAMARTPRTQEAKAVSSSYDCVRFVPSPTQSGSRSYCLDERGWWYPEDAGAGKECDTGAGLRCHSKPEVQTPDHLKVSGTDAQLCHSAPPTCSSGHPGLGTWWQHRPRGC